MPICQSEKIHDMLRDFDSAMLVTRTPSGIPHARPMAVAQVEPDCGLWFFTGRDTLKVQEIASDDQVLIVFQGNSGRYLSLSGVAELVTDRAKAQDLWKETYKVWFPQGVNDPNLVLIRVHADEAEYWDNKGLQGVRYAFEAAKAYLKGTTPKVKEGEQHGHAILN